MAAKRVERELGVTYKTGLAHVPPNPRIHGFAGQRRSAWRSRLEVEIDEIIGGSVSGMGSGYKGNKTCVVGMLERDGDLITRVAGRRTKEAMHGLIQPMSAGTTVNTDEFGGYKT